MLLKVALSRIRAVNKGGERIVYSAIFPRQLYVYDKTGGNWCQR
jgi:hypothetical protein